MRRGIAGAIIYVLDRAQYRAVCVVRILCNGATHTGPIGSEVVLMSRYENTGGGIAHTSSKRHDGARAMLVVSNMRPPPMEMRAPLDVHIIHAPREYYNDHGAVDDYVHYNELGDHIGRY